MGKTAVSFQYGAHLGQINGREKLPSHAYANTDITTLEWTDKCTKQKTVFTLIMKCYTF